MGGKLDAMVKKLGALISKFIEWIKNLIRKIAIASKNIEGRIKKFKDILSKDNTGKDNICIDAILYNDLYTYFGDSRDYETGHSELMKIMSDGLYILRTKPTLEQYEMVRNNFDRMRKYGIKSTFVASIMTDYYNMYKTTNRKETIGDVLDWCSTNYREAISYIESQYTNMQSCKSAVIAINMDDPEEYECKYMIFTIAQNAIMASIKEDFILLTSIIPNYLDKIGKVLSGVNESGIIDPTMDFSAMIQEFNIEMEYQRLEWAKLRQEMDESCLFPRYPITEEEHDTSSINKDESKESFGSKVKQITKEMINKLRALFNRVKEFIMNSIRKITSGYNTINKNFITFHTFIITNKLQNKEISYRQPEAEYTYNGKTYSHIDDIWTQFEDTKEQIASLNRIEISFVMHDKKSTFDDLNSVIYDTIRDLKNQIAECEDDFKNANHMISQANKKIASAMNYDDYDNFILFFNFSSKLHSLRIQDCFKKFAEVNKLIKYAIAEAKKMASDSSNNEATIIDVDFGYECEGMLAEAGEIEHDLCEFEEEVLFENIVGDFVQNQKDIADIRKQWADAADKFVTHRWIERLITPAQEDMLKKWYAVVSKEDVNYGEYKKAYNILCRFMGLPNKGIMMEKIEFANSEKDKGARVVRMQYSKGQIKIKIPEGLSLIHVSPVEGIQALNPSFRNKKLGVFMYPSKRVFFTVAKDIKAKKASISGIKTYRYRTKQKIQYAYIDPSCSDWSVRAVYIETDKPVPVERYDHFLDKIKQKFSPDEKKAAEEKDKAKEAVKEAFFNDPTFMTEGTLSDYLNRLKTWKTANEAKAKQTFVSNRVSDSDFIMMQQLMHQMRTVESYAEYKKAFDRYCKFCHIVPRGTIIYSSEFKKNNNDSDGNYIRVVYAYNTKKIDIPDDADLYHNTTVAGIKELLPFFRGKSAKGYLYDKPRIYFTLNKKMSTLFADYKPGEKTNQYVATQRIKQAYVDPLVPGAINRAIYVETNKPIPVVPVEEKLKQQHEAAQFVEQVMDFIIENDLTIVDEEENIWEEHDWVTCPESVFLSESTKRDLEDLVIEQYASVFEALAS